jgi:cytochrome c oxidase subunit II
MMERFVQSLSTYSGDVDNLIVLVTVLVGFWFLLAEGMFFWLIWRFRARDGVKAQYITGKEKHLKNWINIPHWLIIACDVVIIVAAVRVWYNIKQTLPPADAVVRVTGQQWVWTFQHPGADGKLDTADDIRTSDELHVEVGKTYHFQLESRDVLHSFFVPVFRLKQDAIPGRTITGWFKATKTGAHDILCAEICGIGHGIMGARILIESPEQHVAWVQAHTAVAADVSETPADPAAAEPAAGGATTTTPAH